MCATVKSSINALNTLIATESSFLLLVTLLRYSYFFRGTTLVEHSAVDLPHLATVEGNNSVVHTHPITWYLFLGSELSRLFVFNLGGGKVHQNMSIERLFRNARWLERETGEMYNIFFSGKSDRRALFTIPLFYAAPLRKKYPTSGLYELFFSAETSTLSWRPLSLLN